MGKSTLRVCTTRCKICSRLRSGRVDERWIRTATNTIALTEAEKAPPSFLTVSVTQAAFLPVAVPVLGALHVHVKVSPESAHVVSAQVVEPPSLLTSRPRYTSISPESRK